VKQRIAITAVVIASIFMQRGVLGQSSPRQMEMAECPFAREEWAANLNAECRWLIVPERRDHDDDRWVRLFIVILRAPQPSGRPPLGLLHGGPAESALLRMVRGASRQPLARDIVIYDQRGAGLSQPDPCPAYPTTAAECAAFMRTDHIDPAAYSTPANVLDLMDLRVALGYDRWDLYGASYGSRLAQEAMRRDPHGIRSVILENPVPPGAEIAEAPLTTQRALERVFAACHRSATCHGTFSHPMEDFLAVFDTLVRTPVFVPPPDTTGDQAVLDAEGFAPAIRRLLRSREGIASLPLLLHELRSGDRVRAAGELFRLARSGGGDPVRAAFWLVNCYDQFGPVYRARLDSIRSMAWPPLRGLGGSLAECPVWQESFAAPEDFQPVKSDIPTLVVSGEFDPRTPLEFGRRIAATLSRSYLFEMPGETHGGGPTGCRAAILAEFLQDPEHKPDGSCIPNMPAIEFLTAWQGM